ncbi:MAG: hypothetical protein ACJ72N_21045 [Labedaea sp.]
MSTVLDELIELAWTRPGPMAPAAAVAAWYERKAVMLDHAAAAGALDRMQARRWSRDARRHAAPLADASTRACHDASCAAGAAGSGRWAA